MWVFQTYPTNMESFNISLDHELKLIRVTAIGEMFQADGERIITAAREAATENAMIFSTTSGKRRRRFLLRVGLICRESWKFLKI